MSSPLSRVLAASSVAMALGLLLPHAASTWAQSGKAAPVEDATRVFSALEAEWAQALVSADRAALDRYEHPAYVLVNAAGVTLTRAQADGELLNGHQRFESLKISAVRAWQSGDLAVVTGHSVTRESYLGKDTSGEFEFTDIFVRHEGRWLAVHAQLTRVAGAGN